MNVSTDNSSWFNEENYSYIRQYVLGKIGIRDIPIDNLNEFIISKAIKKEPEVVIDWLFELCESKKFDVDILKYLRLVPNEFRKDEYYDRYFMLNPLVNYLKMPNGKNTQEMAYYLMNLNPSNIKYLYDKHKNKEVCERAFEYDPSLVLYMPVKYIDRKMYFAYLKKVASSIMVDFDDANNNDQVKNSLKYFGPYLKMKIPKDYYTQDLFNQLFEINPKLIVAFPDRVKTYTMCFEAYKKYGNLVKKFIPNNILWDIEYEVDTENMNDSEIQEYCYEKFLDNPVKMLKCIPVKYRTQKMYDLYFMEGGINAVYDIPIEYRTQEMWNMVIFNSSDAGVISELPKKFITQDICDFLYRIHGSASLEYIPNEFLTKEMYMDLFSKDLCNNLSRFSLDKLDEDILSIIVVGLNKLIENKTKCVASFDLVKTIVNLYPHLINAFDKECVDKMIVLELYNIMVNEGTIEGIAKKYNLSVNYINGVLEMLKLSDEEAYESIRVILDNNQNKWFFNMQQDVLNLDIIISSLGLFKDNKMDAMQKVKFAYLCSRYVHNDLEEIYNFNYSKYSKNDYSKIDNFFSKILKYNYLFGNGREIMTIPETKTILFNNSWLKGYNRDMFFALKNGVVTMEHRYGKNASLLTLDREKEIVDELMINDIPLNDMIVQIAFREYFRGNLDNYIKEFKEYDLEFEKIKNERRGR